MVLCVIFTKHDNWLHVDFKVFRSSSILGKDPQTSLKKNVSPHTALVIQKVGSRSLETKFWILKNMVGEGGIVKYV